MEKFDEGYERDMREQQQDGWDDDCSEFEEFGLDPGFASWQDYMNYKNG